MSESSLRIAVIYPELLGTYGDGGNGEVLAARAAWRGLAAELVPVPAGSPVPAGCDLYLLGGGEDEPQILACEALADGALATAVSGGACVLAVCAGFQILGQRFPGVDGLAHDGLGLLPVETRRSWGAASPPRAVGDVVADPVAPLEHLGPLLGYENHGGRTRPVPGASGQALARLRRGVGNDGEDGTEGWMDRHGAGLVVATYLHGPVLAQNPALADHLLEAVHGPLPELTVADPALELRQARLRALAG